jgi:hypothetical protein
MEEDDIVELTAEFGLTANGKPPTVIWALSASAKLRRANTNYQKQLSRMIVEAGVEFKGAQAVKLDELLDALPQVGLRLWLMCDNVTEGWYCVLNEEAHRSTQFYGNGATAVEAIVAALQLAGVELEA